MLLGKPQSAAIPRLGIEKCIWGENKILSTKLRILFHVLFVGAGLCSTEIKGLARDRSTQDMKKRPFYKRICFLCLSMNQFTWYTISIVGLKSIAAKCLGLHWWLDELNREQSVTWEFAHSGYLMPLCCLWSDHSFKMLCFGHPARELSVFWYHSFLIRTKISFQTTFKLPMASLFPLFIYLDRFWLILHQLLITKLMIVQGKTDLPHT